MEYTIDYFIDKFQKIPDDKWMVGGLGEFDKNCAMGFCGGYSSMETQQLASMFMSWHNRYTYLVSWEPVRYVYTVNDNLSINGKCYFDSDTTPKARILAALYDIKKMQQEKDEPKPAPPIKEKIKYVSVSEKIKEDNKDLVLN